jgi:hypothetical protein
MIFMKNGVARPISGYTLFAILLISVLLVASTAAATYAVLSAQGKIGSSGRIVVIGVKVTAVGSSADLTSIEWGDLTAGSTATRQISVTNNGTIPTTLSMSVGDWVPLIGQQYISITWNYASGTVLQPGASQTVTITINVNQYVTGVNTFTNAIYVIATQSS